MTLIAVIATFLAGMVMAGNIKTKWLAFAACPVVAVVVTLLQGLVILVVSGESMGSPLYLVQATIMNTIFTAAFLGLGYWRVSRQQAQSEDRS